MTNSNLPNSFKSITSLGIVAKNYLSKSFFTFIIQRESKEFFVTKRYKS